MAIADFVRNSGSAATLTMTATSAAASQFQLSGGVLVPGGISNVSLNRDGIDLNFDPEPVTPVGITSATGIFTSFNTANISDIISFGPPLDVENPFLDFGNSDFLNVPGVTTPGNASLTDGVNVFQLTNAVYQLSQIGANVAIDVFLEGTFIVLGNIIGLWIKNNC